MGSPSPFVSVSSILWFEAKRHQVLLHHIRPSLLLTSATPTTIHLAFMIFLTQLSSSLRCTWSCHRSLASCIFLSVIQATPTAFQISSFLFLSFSDNPNILCSVRISVLSKSSSSFRLLLYCK